MTASQLDDNMVPGHTYTFQLKLQNWITMPSTSTVQQDLSGYAPDFMSDVQVTVAQTLNILDNTFNIQFTYTGDGSDVISDVANSIVTAISQGSSDNFSFIAAYSSPAGQITTSGGILDTITKTVTDTINTAGEQTKKTAQDLLTPVEIAVGIVAILVIAIVFTAGKSGGVSGGPTGFKVGGK